MTRGGGGNSLLRNRFQARKIASANSEKPNTQAAQTHSFGISTGGLIPRISLELEIEFDAANEALWFVIKGIPINAVQPRDRRFSRTTKKRPRAAEYGWSVRNWMESIPILRN